MLRRETLRGLASREPHAGGRRVRREALRGLASGGPHAGERRVRRQNIGCARWRATWRVSGRLGKRIDRLAGGILEVREGGRTGVGWAVGVG